MSADRSRSRRLVPARVLLASGGMVLLLGACSLPVRLATPAEIKQADAPRPLPPPAVASVLPSPSGSPATPSSPGPSPTPTPSAAASPASGALAQLQGELRQLVNSVLPSVVQIDTNSGVGSGVVVDAQGDIVTNAHVVGSDTSFTVTASNGQAYPATLVGADQNSDLAVIRARGASSLRAATLGDSSGVRMGDIVVAIGSPLGLSDSVSEGIVSGTGRSQPESPSLVLTNLIQTTAPLNPGNSGGALVDVSGHVIGITVLTASSGRDGGGTANIGFAIPSNVARQVAKQLGAAIP